MAGDERFWDRVARRYAAMRVPNPAAYERKLEITRSYLRPDSVVLEFGCGTGSTAIALAPHAGRIRATDISGEMIRVATEKANAAGIATVTFEKARLEDEEDNVARYDVVLGHNILHLMKDWEPAVRRVHGLLKPGGVFISTTACLGGGFWLLWPILRVAALADFAPMVRFFPRYRLTDALRDAGFHLERVENPGRGPRVFIVAIKP